MTIGVYNFLVLACNAQGHAVAPILGVEKVHKAGDVPFGKMRFIRTCEAFIYQQDIEKFEPIGHVNAETLAECQRSAAKSAKTAEVVNTYASRKFVPDRKYRLPE